MNYLDSYVFLMFKVMVALGITGVAILMAWAIGMAVKDLGGQFLDIVSEYAQLVKRSLRREKPPRY